MKKLFAAFCLGVALCAQLAAFPKNVPDALKTAQWIWPYPYLNFDIANSYALFRTPVVLDAAPKKAMAYISADQLYALRQRRARRPRARPRLPAQPALRRRRRFEVS